MASYPVTFATGKHYKVDKSYIWLGSVLTTFLGVFIVLMSGLDGFIRLYLAFQRGFSSAPLFLIVALIILAFVLLFALIFLMYYLSYRNMSFVFDERELSFYSGIIVKKRVHLPYERVQSVNQHAGLLQRLVGVCTVVVDSAGGSSNKGVRIPYIRLRVAERLRSDLFVRKAAGAANAPIELVGEDAIGAQYAAFAQSVPNILDDALGPVGEWRGAYGGAIYAEEPVTFEFGLTNTQLALASFTHPGSLIGALITGLSLLVIFIPVLLFDKAAATFFAMVSIPLVIFIAFVVWVMASVGILLGYGNFKVRRRGTRIEVERGLIARHFSGIDISRIQSVDIKQSLFRRVMRYSELSLGRIDVQSKNTNNKNTETKGLIIHPFLRVDQIDAILSGLLPEFENRPRLSDCKPIPSIALRRSILRRALWFNWVLWIGLVVLAALFATQWAAHTYGLITFREAFYFDYFIQVFVIITLVCIAIATGVAVVGSVLWARHSGYNFSGKFLLIHNDGLYTATSLLPRQKIQSGNTRMNPFQRRLQLQTIVATTAAGYRKTDIRLLDVPQTDAVAYLEWLR